MGEAKTTSGTCLLMGLLALSTPVGAAELKPAALRGFEQYVRRTEERVHSEVQNGKTFLWVYSLPAARREETLEQLRRGEIVMERLEAGPAGRAMVTPGAMIHHWVGTVLIPGARLAQVLRTIQNYDCHQEYFRPEVVRSRTLERDGDDFTVYLRLQKTKMVTAVFDTEHQVHYNRLDAWHAYSESRSTRITELNHAGEAGEQALPPGDDHGFLWRLNSYWRFVETREGVYVQCEAVSLTRDIPLGLGWVVGPFIESIPKESLNFTLQSTRAAVFRARPDNAL